MSLRVVDGNYVVVGSDRHNHLAKKPQKMRRTLCHQIITMPVDSIYRDPLDEVCAKCTELAREEYRKALEASTYSFTITTDASLYTVGDDTVAAGACWIKSTHYKVQHSELLPDNLPNSSLAELLTVGMAIRKLNELVDKEIFLQHQIDTGLIRVVINTDSLFTIQVMQQSIKVKSKYKPYLDRILSVAKKYDVHMRHVKGHTDGKEARQYVNNWCDEQSRTLAKKRRDALYGE